MSWDAEGRYYAEKSDSAQPLLSDNGSKKRHGDKLSHDPDFRGVVVEGRKFHDVLFGLIFVAMLVVMGAVLTIGFVNGDPAKLIPSAEWKEKGESIAEFWLQDAVAIMKRDVDVMAGSLGLAFVLAVIWTLLLKSFTKLFVYATLFLGVFLVFAAGITSVSYGFTNSIQGLKIGGFCLLGFGVILIILMAFFRKKITLTCALYQECCKGVGRNPAVFLVASLVFVLIAAFIALWVSGFLFLYSIPGDNVDVHIKNEPYHFNTNVRYLILFNVFGFYWTVAFLMAVFQTSVAGAIASWYFTRDVQGHTATGSPALRTLGWAVTKSFGSLAFGSLILAIIQFLNYLVSRAQKLTAKNRLLSCFFCCLKCCVSCVEVMIQFIDRFAYVYIAMHGESFIGSAKKSFHLVKRNAGMVAVIDAIGHFVLFVGKIFGTAFCTLAAVSLLAELDREISVVTVGFVVIASFVTFSLFASIIGTGVDTVFICYLEDLERNGEGKLYIDPALHQHLQSQVVEMSDH